MGMIFDIERFSLSDGPGIRTTVFLKGCPLRCLWCHNPESVYGRPEIAFFKDKCLDCGACTRVCGLHTIKDGKHFFGFTGCSACGKCAKVCPSGAMKLYGYEMSAREVVDIAMRDEVYYKSSGGGITVSGGEPMYQEPVKNLVLHNFWCLTIQ